MTHRRREIENRIETIYDEYDSPYGRARMSEREWQELELERKRLEAELRGLVAKRLNDRVKSMQDEVE